MAEKDSLFDEAAATAARARAENRQRNSRRTSSASTGGDGEADTPPKRTRAKKEPKTTLNPDGERTPRWRKLEQQLVDMYSTLALPFAAAGDAFCANVIASNAETLASSWVDLAQQNAGVAKVLDSLVTGAGWGGVIMTHAYVAIPIASHHNLIPGPVGIRLRAMYGMFEDDNPPNSASPNGAPESGIPIS